MKYTTDQRLRWVKLYLKDHIYEYPEMVFTCRGKKTFRKMVRFYASRYRAEGLGGIAHGRNRSFGRAEKLAAIRPILCGETCPEKRSLELGILDGTLISWIRKYRESGIKGLECSKRGRKPMNKKTSAKKADRSLPGEEEELEKLREENLYLRAENAYLKKLKSLVDARAERESGKKPSQYKASSKAKTDSR